MAITVSKVLNAKPKNGQLKPGEVAQYTDAKGRTLYVIGTVSGNMTQPTNNLKNAEKKYNSVLKATENAQLVNLKEENKIEIIELQRTLKDKGLSQAEINAAVKAEQRNNDAELASAKRLLGTAGYQTLSRNGTTGTLTAFDATDTAKGFTVPTSFNVSAITNPDGSKSYKWNSLSYTGTGADEARSTIESTLDQVNRLKVSYGLLNDTYTYTGGGDSQSTTGVSNAALYGAIRDGYIKFDSATNDFYVDYAGDQTNTKRDENGFGWTSQQLRKIGGKGFERGIQNIINRGTSIGDKAFTTTKNGQTFITTADGKTIKGGALKDSGEETSDGKKIFTQVSNLDTKYNKATTANVYVQNPNGSFTYMGTPDVAYTHIEKKDSGFSLGGFVAKALLTVAATSLGQPWLAGVVSKMIPGISDTLATSLAGALIGGGVSAATGGSLKDIITDTALAGLGTGVGDVLSKAADYYGGWTGLATEMLTNPDDVWDGITNIATAAQAAGTGIKLKLDATGKIIDAASGGAFTSPGIPKIDASTSMADLSPGVNITSGAGGLLGSDQLSQQIDNSLLGDIVKNTPGSGSVTAGDILDAQMPDLAGATNAVDFNVTSGVYAPPPLIDLGLNASGQYSSPGIKLGLDAAGNIIDANTGLPFTGQGVNLYNAATGTYVNPPPTTGFGTGGTTGGSTGGTGSSGNSLVDDAINAVKDNPLTTAAVVGGVTLVPAVVDNIMDKLTPDNTMPNYPAVDLYGVGTDYQGLGNPNWFNNLYERQGFGAGQYLGYDILNNLGIPEDVLGLLGGSVGQNTRSSLIA